MTDPTENAIEAACQEFWGDNWKNGNARDPELVDAMRRTIAAYEKAMWRPIEEAPLDGTQIDLWVPGRGRITDCVWGEAVFGPHEGNCVWLCNGLDRRLVIAAAPTLFRPLPSLPENEK